MSAGSKISRPPSQGFFYMEILRIGVVTSFSRWHDKISLAIFPVMEMDSWALSNYLMTIILTSGINRSCILENKQKKQNTTYPYIVAMI